jgi:hypothetical protein
MNHPDRAAAIPVDAMDEWLGRAANRGIRLDELQVLGEQMGLDLRQSMDAIACRVAERYLTGAWSFAFCYGTITALFALMRQTRQCPDLAFAIFFAFCAGEQTPPRATPGVSAEDVYTRPMMARVLPGRWPGRSPGRR